MRVLLAAIFGVIAVAAGAVCLYLQFAGTPGAAPVGDSVAEISQASAPVADAEAPPAAAPVSPASAEAPPEESEKRARSLDVEEALEAVEAQSADQAVADAVEAVAAAAGAPAPVAAPAAEPEPAPTAAAPPQSVEDQFKARQVTYNRPPATLALDRTIDVSLVINATGDASAGAEALQGFPGTIVEREVALSDSVSAQLTGVGFNIESQTVVRQKLSERTINRWQWRVTPTEPGTHTLILEIFGYATGSNDAEPLDAYRDEIRVEVQQVERLVKMANAYQPLFAAIAGVAGLVSAFFAFMRFRTERKRGAGS